ncbi:MAG: hypothetical protein HXY50_06605 [Ignavibacteriaceae bacterium]|nr:hypothetical protein [Ignavibacteriaceae bacterium]
MKVNRKKFFLIGSTSFLGIALLKKLPFSLFRKKWKSNYRKIDVKINSSAISRQTKEVDND